MHGDVHAAAGHVNQCDVQPLGLFAQPFLVVLSAARYQHELHLINAKGDAIVNEPTSCIAYRAVESLTVDRSRHIAGQYPVQEANSV